MEIQSIENDEMAPGVEDIRDDGQNVAKSVNIESVITQINDQTTYDNTLYRNQMLAKFL